MPLGAQAANTVLSRIAGTQPAALSQAFVGQCISLGRSYATLQLARHRRHPGERRSRRPDRRVDQRGDLQGARCGRFAARPPSPGSYFWLKGGKRPEQLANDAVTVP